MGRLISTHALREEGDLIIASIKHLVVISTHALREEGDLLRLLRPLRIFDFYPRPPRGGRRKSAVQSWDSVHFYPRPPRGGRHELFDNSDKFTIISTHALREEGDRPECRG